MTAIVVVGYAIFWDPWTSEMVGRLAGHGMAWHWGFGVVLGSVRVEYYVVYKLGLGWVGLGLVLGFLGKWIQEEGEIEKLFKCQGREEVKFR
jgi:hypothetical protein